MTDYKSAGVDIEAGDEAVFRMKQHVHATFNERVLTDIGSFGGMFAADFPDFSQPVLVSSIDGVGTKVKIAAMMDKYDTIGADLVNHCVNDILVQGAKPLFFLDYFASSKLVPQIAEQVVKGMSDACLEANCALIGGETAEMPGVYVDGELDLAGCIVGIVEREKIVDGSRIRPGDVVVGIASSGLHTNGYSLVRKIFFEDNDYKVDQYVPELGATLGEVLLATHRCYLKPLMAIMEEFDVRGIAHLTGGGFYNNIPRVLPIDCQVTVERRYWGVPPIFTLLQEKGNIDPIEMHRAFNMGIGMVLIVSNHSGLEVVARLQEFGETASVIGEVHKGGREVNVI
ncbi:MAG: phosphoribosylformylglycinamidine cyclo-ligase [Armatimonadetes bacterium]|jgi:phosphoribosylformylglycinamidine cyclo-ligase|nr:phosphoribosylformylglycinamidine cyclo-ligase [Armatimonadota bacterium]